MEAFTSLDAIGIPVDIPNCDTAQIIPARLLSYTPDEPGYARFLFHDLRFDEDGGEKPAFIYNQAPFSEARSSLLPSTGAAVRRARTRYTPWSPTTFGA